MGYWAEIAEFFSMALGFDAEVPRNCESPLHGTKLAGNWSSANASSTLNQRKIEGGWHNRIFPDRLP